MLKLTREEWEDDDFILRSKGVFAAALEAAKNEGRGYSDTAVPGWEKGVSHGKSWWVCPTKIADAVAKVARVTTWKYQGKRLGCDWRLIRDFHENVEGQMSLQGWLRYCEVTGHHDHIRAIKAWRLAGCAFNQKFETCCFAASLYSLDLVKKGMSADQVRCLVRGARWFFHWHEHFALNSRRVSVKVFIALGRIDPDLRFVAMSDIAEGEGPIRIRDLNWTSVTEAQRRPSRAMKAMPTEQSNRRQWDRVLPGMKDIRTRRHPLATTSPAGFSTKKADAFLKALGVTMTAEQVMADNSLSVPMANIVSLFGNDTAGYLRYIEQSYGREGWRNQRDVLHDSGQFQLPADGNWDRKHWAGLVLRIPQVLLYGALFSRIEKIMGTVPTTLRQVEIAAAKVTYSRGPNNPELAELCSGHRLSEPQFEDYLWLCKDQKVAEYIPAVRITKEDMVIRQLQASDLTGPMLGLVTDCCQHLHAAGAASAIHGWKSPYGAFLVVEEKGVVVAQSWVWRSEDDVLVIDSVEQKGGFRAKVPVISTLYSLWASAVLGRLGVRKVCISSTSYGCTAEVANLLISDRVVKKAPKPVDTLGYTDSSAGVIKVISLAKGKTKHTSSGEGACGVTQAEVTINALLDGSGVFCEHCDAEVHPNTAICPSCGRDISEWV